VKFSLINCYSTIATLSLTEEEVTSLLTTAHTKYVKAFGEDSPQATIADSRLATFLRSSNKYEQSCKLLQDVIQKRLDLIDRKKMVNYFDTFSTVIIDYSLCLGVTKGTKVNYTSSHWK